MGGQGTQHPSNVLAAVKGRLRFEGRRRKMNRDMEEWGWGQGGRNRKFIIFKPSFVETLF
jgi:hypothetical protein